MTFYNKISTLVFKYINGNISSEEMEELNEWLKDSSNKILFEEICSEDNLNFNYLNYTKAKDLKSSITSTLFKKEKRNLFLSAWIKYAAIIMLPLALGVILFHIKDKPGQEIVAQSTINPGKPQAKLTLANGQKIFLEENKKVDLTTRKGTSIKSDEGTIKYSSAELQNKKTDNKALNILEIPIGGEYKLVLSDGTNVWINSETVIRYPEVFKGKYRKVYLKGEAYFEVTKNAKMPFIVSTDKMDIRVLGTSFNVNAYEQEVVSATLVEGSVEVGMHNKDVMLVPGERLSYNSTKKSITKEKVDTDFITGWKNGRLVFDNTTLEEIMTRISRWYGVEVFYHNSEVRDLRFTFNIEKYSDIQDVLDLIKETDKINFKIKNKNIIIRKGK